jgi:molybdopterin converting factor small subunit
MVISIDFCGMQRSHTKTGSIEVKLSDSLRVTDVLKYLKERFPQLSLDEKFLLATVNQEVATLDRELKANDKVAFLPHIGGG